MSDGPKTRHLERKPPLLAPALVILGGPDKGKKFELRKMSPRLIAGSSLAAELRFPELAEIHAELALEPDGSALRVRDRSGGQTRLNGAPVREGLCERGGTLALGPLEFRLQDQSDAVILPSSKNSFGSAYGAALAMREIFGVMEVVAPTDVTVLLLGETGTGKDVLARATHQSSPRRDQTFLAIDCGALAPSVVEAELFGYERGAFTGAEEKRAGAFEAAHGGTLFLDEIGELPLDVQPKLLRVLDERRVHRVGGSNSIPVDVRIVAATKRNLTEEVSRGRFREDLWFRLAVVPMTLPPLRDRREDIPLLVQTFAQAFAEKHGPVGTIEPEEIQRLAAHDWPGNVRELKNTVERALWMARTGDGTIRFLLPSAEALFAAPKPEKSGFDPNISFSQHKQTWEEEFERRYLPWLMARAEGSISLAARLARADRKHLRTLLRRHGLAKTEPTDED